MNSKYLRRIERNIGPYRSKGYLDTNLFIRLTGGGKKYIKKAARKADPFQSVSDFVRRAIFREAERVLGKPYKEKEIRNEELD